jgi:hypothetical protein
MQIKTKGNWIELSDKAIALFTGSDEELGDFFFSLCNDNVVYDATDNSQRFGRALRSFLFDKESFQIAEKEESVMKDNSSAELDKMEGVIYCPHHFSIHSSNGCSSERCACTCNYEVAMMTCGA